MAGHSKWANIRFRKGAQDIKRGKIFTKLIREITVAAKEGGDDLENNAKLRMVMDKANRHNVPKDTIQRAIKRAVGGESAELTALTYEGYAPNGVAVMVTCLTDNRNRSASDVRHTFSKYGGNLGTDGSVSYLFSQHGLIDITSTQDEDSITELVLEVGGDDLILLEPEHYQIVTSKEAFMPACVSLNEAEVNIVESALGWVAQSTIDLNETQAEGLLKLIEALEALDDVENVYTNAKFPDPPPTE